MRSRARLPIFALTLAALSLAAGTSGLLSASAQAPAGVEITGKGVGGVTLRAKYQRLHRAGVLGKRNRGCELAGPGSAGAPLSSPLAGSVNLTRKKKNRPRRVADILLTGGPATARGVGIGATLAQVQSAFPEAKVDHGTEQVFGITSVKVPASAGGPFIFGVDQGTGTTKAIGIPFIAFCE